ncbi:glycoside hydrolase family 3 protein [Ligilactobacillus saerimneri]|uniref:glycoside hydrolase family 3 protein n=1 Tax=Ligilactobacillus saerimneri TaxID=228229 RepID=UPI001C0FF09C|nr:glycoside hydrolase family 3 N-terminal domain-containing protein [Ligilactobacillus saerimneri]MBU5309297.1 beta-N-acetylhexosaminidase [Ligilactobacillus saerimneri]
MKKLFLKIMVGCLGLFLVSGSVQAKKVSNKKINKIVKKMTLDEKIGQMYVSPSSGNIDTMISDSKNYHLGGIVLFGSDFAKQDAQAMKAKDQALQKASRYGAFIATDQEGGTVSRLSTYPGLTNNRKFPAPQTVYKQKGMAGVVTEYSAVAKIMHGLGINWNFAPVADVTTDQGSFIYPRTLGENYQITANYVKQVVPAIQKQKVGATLKHFPGYGAAADTHVGFASDNRSLDVFRQNDFLPFVAGIKAGADSLLVGHVVMKSVDGSKPASLSKPVHDLVRKELKFKGVIVTDDMNMGAVTKFAQEKKINADVLAVMAGNDMLLSSDYKTGIPAIKAEIKRGNISTKQINRSVTRILKMKARLGILKY